MSPPHRRTWIAVGVVLTVSTAVAATTLANGASASGADPVVVESAASAEISPAMVHPRAAGDPGDRATAFRQRMAMFAPLEAGLRRAFFGEPQVAHAASAVRAARVHPAGTAAGCLTQAVYYEARGEPAEGQAAVAQVVLNRTRSGAHPADVCGVVFEGAAHAGCQFSFACDPRLGARRPQSAAWRRAQTIADAALHGSGRPDLRDALNFHADYVRPGWAQRLRRAVEIGRHIFYGAPSPASPPVLAE